MSVSLRHACRHPEGHASGMPRGKPHTVGFHLFLSVQGSKEREKYKQPSFVCLLSSILENDSGLFALRITAVQIVTKGVYLGWLASSFSVSISSLQYVSPVFISVPLSWNPFKDTYSLIINTEIISHYVFFLLLDTLPCGADMAVEFIGMYRVFHKRQAHTGSSIVRHPVVVGGHGG